MATVSIMLCEICTIKFRNLLNIITWLMSETVHKQHTKWPHTGDNLLPIILEEHNKTSKKHNVD